MNTLRIEQAIKKQIGELHRRRHPSKGVVINFPEFESSVEKRNALLHRLREHRTNLPILIKKRDLLARTIRRWGHIRNALADGASLSAISFDMIGGQIDGVVFFDGVHTKIVSVSDRKSVIEAYKALTNLAKSENGYIVGHDFPTMSEKLAETGIQVPPISNTIDLAYTTQVLFGEKYTSVETGQLVNIVRDRYSDYSDYLIAVARAYSALDSITDLDSSRVIR